MTYIFKSLKELLGVRADRLCYKKAAHVEVVADVNLRRQRVEMDSTRQSYSMATK